MSDRLSRNGWGSIMGDADGGVGGYTDDGGRGGPSSVVNAVGYAGSAVAALAVGLAAVACYFAVPPLGGLVGIIAIVVGLRSRRQLRDEPLLRGASLSLAGFLLGLIVTVCAFLPLVLPLIYTGAFFLVR